jgi:hypothetical protein
VYGLLGCRSILLVHSLADILNLKMESIDFSETLDYRRTTRRYNPDDGTLQFGEDLQIISLPPPPFSAVSSACITTLNQLLRLSF